MAFAAPEKASLEPSTEKVSSGIQQEKELIREKVAEKHEPGARGDFGAPLIPSALLPQSGDKNLGKIKSQVLQNIELILQEDIGYLYSELSPPDKEIFKQKGEMTATKIRMLLNEATEKVWQIFKLIVEWLKYLPGVNRSFIEQEAKIKTDKIVRLNKRQNDV